MKGNIYTKEKCFICGTRLQHVEDKNGCYCTKHPHVTATKDFKVRFGREITRRFKSYQEAIQFLWGLRWKTVEGSFDARDYKNESPMGFENQVDLWLGKKLMSARSPNTYRNIEREIGKAVAAWGNRNVKTIGYAEIEDFLYGFNTISEKTRANICSILHDFWVWLCEREESIRMPRFPKIRYELGWRNIIDFETQKQILDEVKRISQPINPKIWIGIKWLATYIAIRPNELRNLRERHINVNGFLVIPSPKEKKPKLVAMNDEDIRLYRSLPQGMPDLHFFRHTKGNGTAKPGSQFGKDYLYTWWKQACRNLGIENVDLYGGTRHSTTTALSGIISAEELRTAGTMHSTNQAFERYFQAERNMSRKIYAKIEEVREGRIIALPKAEGE